MQYYVYQLRDPRSNKIFYIGKGTGQRAYSHGKFKDGNNNPYKDGMIEAIHERGLEPIVEIVKTFTTEADAYEHENQLIESIGLDHLTNMVIGSAPPSRRGWHPSPETLAKRSQSLRGIKRTEEWRANLSASKKGENNPMFGKKLPCTEQRRLAVIRGKNIKNYETFKQAIDAMNAGLSADAVAKNLGISRGICFRLKNRSHGFFDVFPELK